MTTAKKVLLIDDDPDFTEVHRAILEGSGYEVGEAHSSKEALPTAKAFHPDVVVLDVMMEQWDSGFAVARQIRADHHLAGTPILMVTGVTEETGFEFGRDPEERQEWLQVNDYISKPVLPQEFLEKVSRLAASSQVEAH
ncbi:MAG: response regulator [Armatimonadetes bacterium]|nr:response regulator [Armatimonadota bacterium]